MKVLKCERCGKIVVQLDQKPCPTMCCGQPMAELVPNTVDAALEKHVPVIEQEGNIVTVKVGSVTHPMVKEHYIQFIALVTKNAVQYKALNPEEEPKAVFALPEGDEVVNAYEYCNLHGFWAAK